MIIKAPNPVLLKDNSNIIFLAGSIEMGAAENWQDEVADVLNTPYNIILNPRRDGWSNTWDQSINNDEFKKQVEWELNWLQRSDSVVFYFAENTKSPITLMELGYIAGLKEEEYIETAVYCHPNFWRRGNVEVMCERSQIPFYTDKAEFLIYIKGAV